MRKSPPLFALLATAAAILLAPRALMPGEVSTEPTVVELFTSQSCYSCPPAEAFLGELLETHPDILALEFHVDYWDKLNYGSAGRWKDIFSSPTATTRQRVYNQAIRGRSAVYTPQIVIDGTVEAVGSDRRTVLAELARAGGTSSQPLQVSLAAPSDGELSVSVNGKHGDAGTVWLVVYLREHTTDVVRGENKGKQLTNHNIVRDVRALAEWQGEPLQLDVSDLDLPPGHGCAVLVQNLEARTGELGPVLGAAVCPSAITT